TILSCATSTASIWSAFFSPIRPPPRPTLFPYTTLFRSNDEVCLITFPKLFIHNFHDCFQGLLLIFTMNQQVHDIIFLRAQCDHRSEEHTSELQSRENLVCRLLLEKKNNIRGTKRKKFSHFQIKKYQFTLFQEMSISYRF